MAPVHAELMDLRGRLVSTPYITHYDIAEADAAFEQSITMPECISPDASSRQEHTEKALADARRQIAVIETKLAVR
jgi:hypothetical protein